MALPGELSGIEGTVCDCGRELKLEVLHTPAGYYLGYKCGEHGSWSRETGYYQSREEAEEQLELTLCGFTPAKLRDTNYH